MTKKLKTECPRCFGSGKDIVTGETCACGLVREYPAPTAPGLYAHFLNGFPADEYDAYYIARDDQGVDGPRVGPLDSVGLTYGNLRLHPSSVRTYLDFDLDDDVVTGLDRLEDMPVLHGVAYGDVIILMLTQGDIDRFVAGEKWV